jgi:hypothetical protein
MSVNITEKIVSKFKEVFFHFFGLKNYSYEILKAQIFNDTIRDCCWLKYKNFSTNGWAVDYALLYTMFRVLNNMKPKKIIEFGLGESSKLIHQYATYYDEVEAVTVEHDEKWIDFFKQSINGNYTLNIHKAELCTEKYRKYTTLSYKDIMKPFHNYNFNFLFVDGPYGSNRYSRSQIVKFIPDLIASTFCILIDDCNRKGEMDTVKEICRLLNDNNIEYHKAFYRGMKKHCLICSKDMIFLTSLSLI